MNCVRTTMIALLLAVSAHAQERPAQVLRVIVAAEEEPETFALSEGPVLGFEREMLEGFAKLHGFRLEVVPAPRHADRIPMLLERRGDVIAAIFDTPERRRQVSFTTEVMPTFNVVVTLRGRPAVDDLERLKGMTVAVVKGTQPEKDALAAGLSNLRGVTGKADLIRALRTGDAAAAVMSVSEFSLAKRQVPELVAGLKLGEQGRVAWATRQGDVALRADLDAYLTSVRRTATWSRLLIKYFGEDALVVLGRR